MGKRAKIQIENTSFYHFTKILNDKSLSFDRLCVWVQPNCTPMSSNEGIKVRQVGFYPHNGTK